MKSKKYTDNLDKMKKQLLEENLPIWYRRPGWEAKKKEKS
jgi:hypothetical protein